MCRKIDCYIEAFTSMNTGQDKSKPLLLLAVLDLIAAKKINREFIEPGPELFKTYAGYCQRVTGNDTTSDLAKPFYDMAEEPFWTLAPCSGVTLPKEKVHTLEKFKELYLGARLDPELFKLALMKPLRKKLRDALIISFRLKI